MAIIFFNDLKAGVGGDANFVSVIEHYQDHRFYDFGNIGMVFGSASRVLILISQLLKKSKTMPFTTILCWTCPNRSGLVKAIRDLPNGAGYELVLYDSNYRGQP